MTESINDLMKRLTDKQVATHRQFTELQQQLASSQETLTKLVVQKIEECGYTFRKKGHEKQWYFNKMVDSHIGNVLDALKKIPWSTDENTAKIMDNIQEKLTKAWEKIADHQKIKMADGSEDTELGWWKRTNAMNW